jgi:hypothetical protein
MGQPIIGLGQKTLTRTYDFVLVNFFALGRYPVSFASVYSCRFCGLLLRSCLVITACAWYLPFNSNHFYFAGVMFIQCWDFISILALHACVFPRFLGEAPIGSCPCLVMTSELNHPRPWKICLACFFSDPDPLKSSWLRYATVNAPHYKLIMVSLRLSLIIFVELCLTQPLTLAIYG